VRGHPGQGHLLQRPVKLRGYRAQGVQHGPVVVAELGAAERIGASKPAFAAGTGRAAGVFAGQKTARQRAPRHHAQGLGRRQVLALDSPRHQRVFQLHGDGPRYAVGLGQRGGPGGKPSGHVGEAEVADFARPHQVAQRLQHFLRGRDGVSHVQPVEVDVIGLEPAQRAFQRLVNVLAAVAAGVRVARLRPEAKFGGQHELVA